MLCMFKVQFLMRMLPTGAWKWMDSSGFAMKSTCQRVTLQGDGSSRWWVTRRLFSICHLSIIIHQIPSCQSCCILILLLRYRCVYKLSSYFKVKTAKNRLCKSLSQIMAQYGGGRVAFLSKKKSDLTSTESQSLILIEFQFLPWTTDGV